MAEGLLPEAPQAAGGADGGGAGQEQQLIARALEQSLSASQGQAAGR